MTTTPNTEKKKNLIYIAQEKAFAPNIAGEWPKIIKPKGMSNARLKAVNVSDEIMKLIVLEDSQK